MALPIGERLWRVHDRCLGRCTFTPPYGDKPRAVNRWDEGRFDPTPDDPFPTLNAAMSAEAAAAECLVRSVPFSTAGYRSLPSTATTNLSVSTLKSARSLRLVALLTLDDLHRVAQDDWLVTAEPCDYAATQTWARWLRELAPEAQGMIWPSTLFPGIHLVVLFGDRTPENCVKPDEPSIELDTAEGTKWLTAMLKPWGIDVAPSAVDLRTKDDKGQDLPTISVGPVGEADKSAESSLPDFRIFFKAHLRMVGDIVNAAVLDRELANDAAQQAMLIAYRKWDTVAHHANPVGYVIKTAKRIAFAVQATEAKKGLLGASGVNQWYDHGFFNIDQVGRADDRLALGQAIRQISRNKAEVFLLHDYYRYTEQEIARLLDDIPVGTVKSRLHAARRELQMLLRSTFRGLGRFP